MRKKKLRYPEESTQIAWIYGVYATAQNFYGASIWGTLISWKGSDHGTLSLFFSTKFLFANDIIYERRPKICKG